MPRRARVFVEGGVYHVYNRVASGEDVFADREEGLRFVDLIRDVKKRDGWTVFAWCLMSNHYHLVLRTSSVPLWRGMHHLQNTFSREFNRRNGRTGGLWQSRYQAKQVDEQRYLSQVVLYVHLNPVRAGVVSDPAQHHHSGHREIVKRARRPLVDVEDTLLSFGQTVRSARRAYRASIRAGVEDAGGADGGMLDDLRNLVWQDRKLEPGPGRSLIDIQGLSTGLWRPPMPAEQFISRACAVLAVEKERLASLQRDSRTAELRRMVVTVGVERWSQKGTELAAVLGKNPDVVSWWVGQGVRRRLEDQGFAKQLDDVDRELARREGSNGRDSGDE